MRGDASDITIKNSVVYAKSVGSAVIGGGSGSTGSNISIEESFVQLDETDDSYRYDIIGNSSGSAGDAKNIFITHGSVWLNTYFQNSPIYNSRNEQVFMLEADNADGAKVIVNGELFCEGNQSKVNENDTGVYIWVTDGDQEVTFEAADGTSVSETYHFNEERRTDMTVPAFKLCEADTSSYEHDETAHWYKCAGSEKCTVKFNYQEHSGGTATCTEKAVCDVCDTEYGNALGHDMDLYTAVSADCLNDGHKQYYYCGRCDKYFEDVYGDYERDYDYFVIPAYNHPKNSLYHYTAVEATCTDDGNIEYFECSLCGKLFTDEDCTNETTLARVTLAATGHDMTKHAAVAATCTDDGNIEYYTCENCGKLFTDKDGSDETSYKDVAIPALGHDSTFIPETVPTCTTDGNMDYYYCERCGKVSLDGDDWDEVTSDYVVEPAMGHMLTTREASNPTCEIGGNVKFYFCVICTKCFTDEDGKNETDYSSVSIAPLGHDLTKYAKVEPSCTSDGCREYYMCNRCKRFFADADGKDELQWYDLAIPATGHDMTKHAAAAATCTTAGNIEYYTCGGCGGVFTDAEGNDRTTLAKVTIKATGHKLTKHVAVAAACTTTGTIEYYSCDNCGKLFTDAAGRNETTSDKVTIAAKGHKMTKHAAVEATCTTAGNKEYYTCGTCGKLFTDAAGKNETTLAKVTVAATGHKMTKHAAAAATCTTAGNKEYYTCGNCGKVFTDAAGRNETTLAKVTIAAKGHKMTKHAAVEATCTTKGNVEYYTCGNCGKIFSDAAGKNETTLVKVTIAAKGHKMTKHAATAATCKEKGNKEYYSCDNCGKLFTDANGKYETTLAKVTIAATGRHEYGEWTVTKEADCTNDGERARTCANCGTVQTEVIAKLGHKYGSWTVTKEADCTNDGEKTRTCEVCGGVQTEVIAKLGHRYGSWKTIVKATKNSEGLKQRECSVCGEIDEQVIPKIKTGTSGSKWYPDDTMPSVGGETKPWDEVRSDILGTSEGDVTVIDMNDGDNIPANVIRALKTSGSTGEFVINDTISIIIDGKKVTNADDIKITPASGDTAGLRGSIVGTINIGGINVPYEVRIKLKSEDEGKFFNLYRNSNGEKTYIGTAGVGTDGTATVPVSDGGELIAMICEFSDILGDADNDGAVNAKDAAHLLRFVVGMGQLNNPAMADFDRNGAANARDAAAILRKVVGL